MPAWCSMPPGARPPRTAGRGGRTPGHRYYNARGEWDQPNGIAFYGTEATIIAERIGWEIFPEPRATKVKRHRCRGGPVMKRFSRLLFSSIISLGLVTSAMAADDHQACDMGSQTIDACSRLIDTGIPGNVGLAEYYAIRGWL